MITVYTCATNGRDPLREDHCAEGAHFIAYTDCQLPAGSVWSRRSASELFSSDRRNARLHKILSHQFVDTDCSIWIDANVALRVPAARLVEQYLGGADLAVFRHRARHCTYQEAARCAELALDDVGVIDEQMRRYRAAGLPENLGLAETTVLLRRHTPGVRHFNEMWWSELCRHSVRDQLSFAFAAWRAGLVVRYITPTKFDHPAFSITVRPPGVETARRRHG